MPAAEAWFGQFAIGLGVSAVVEVAKYGLQQGVKKWDSTWRRRVSVTRGDSDWRYQTDGYYRTSVSPVLLVSVIAQSVAVENPANWETVVILKKGAEGVHLTSWAWLTLSTFAANYLEEGDDDALPDRKALLSYAVTPSGKRDVKVESEGKLVAAVTYKTATGGFVELAKVEASDHTFTSRIKISGMPDQTGLPRVDEFVLPENF